MSEHNWKVGDWAEVVSSGTRYLVVSTYGETIGVAFLGSLSPVGCLLSSSAVEHLPDCTGWDWQATKPIEAGEGYRLIDRGVDKLQEGDEWIDSNGDWIQSENLGFGYATRLTYRRKVEPQYKPWTFETMPIAVKVRDKQSKSVLRLFSPASRTTVYANGLGFFRYEDLLTEFEQIDGTPCGVPI